MTASSWKILGFAAGLALVGTAGACTVTTTNGGDDDGLDYDSGVDNSDTGTTSDSGTTDTGTTTCTGREEITEAGTTEITLDTDGGTACDDCMDNNCCTSLGACFQDPTGGCQNLESCLEACVESPDAGGCTQDCADLYPDSVTLHNNWSDCQTSSCANECP
jgi:hypothetical protein